VEPGKEEEEHAQVKVEITKLSDTKLHTEHSFKVRDNVLSQAIML
jgi:hypothetical protein